MSPPWVGLLCTLAGVVLLISLLAVRTVLAIRGTHAGPRSKRRGVGSKASLAIFLGSGGHTAEMMRLVAGVDWNRYHRRTYVVSSGDTHSETKALELEKNIGSGTFEILRIPRARRVHQSYLTSPFTTLYSLAYCLWYITLRPLLSMGGQKVFADLILLNGPGSCVPIVLSAFLPKIFFLPSPSLIYIESLARTRRLSVSAILVRPFVDRFFVQWQGLKDALDGKEGAKGRDRWKLRAVVECEGWLV